MMICDPRWVYKSRTTFVNLCHDKKTYWGIPGDVTITIICLNRLVSLQATERLGTRVRLLSLYLLNQAAGNSGELLRLMEERKWVRLGLNIRE